MTPRILAILSGALFISAVASAQTPPAAAPAAPAQPAAAAAAPAATPPPAGAQKSSAQAALESPGYTYDPQGRRDPFVSLLRRGSSTDAAHANRAPGIAGIETSEVTLKGTMQSRTGYVALIESPDKKTYIVKAGDRLLDGTVQMITANGMVILQQVHDPLSLEKMREVRKMLRQADEVK